LEIFVVPDGDRVGGGLPASVVPLGDAAFQVSFVPEVPRDHLIYVTFNDKSIPGNLNNFINFTNQLVTTPINN